MNNKQFTKTKIYPNVRLKNRTKSSLNSKTSILKKLWSLTKILHPLYELNSSINKGQIPKYCRRREFVTN